MMTSSISAPVPMKVPSIINCRSSFEEFHDNAMDLEEECSTSSTYDLYPTPTTSYTSLSDATRKHRNTRNVLVYVGGEAFSFPLWAFQKFLALPWKMDPSLGTFCLNSSAAVFEVLLDYTLFGTMPAYDTLSSEEFQEFETMALSMGGLTALIEHFDRKDSYLTKELRHGRKNRRTSRHFVVNPEDCHSSSPNSIAATRCVRFLGALCSVAEVITRRNNSNNGSSSSSSSSNSNSRQ